jgi:hypothetical protein
MSSEIKNFSKKLSQLPDKPLHQLAGIHEGMATKLSL